MLCVTPCYMVTPYVMCYPICYMCYHICYICYMCTPVLCVSHMLNVLLYVILLLHMLYVSPHMYVCYPICICYPMLYVLPHVYHSYLFPFCSARCGLVHWLINWFFGLSVAGSYVAQADLNSLGSWGWPPPSEFWDYRQFVQAVVTALGLNWVSMHARQSL